jgi:phosphonate transport system substrate-binding protein
MLTRRRALAGLGGLIAAAGTSRSRRSFAVEPLRFGLTPVLLTSDLDLLDHLRDYLEAATQHSIELVTRRTYQEITTLLVSGQLSAAWICGYPYVAYRSQLDLLAVPIWHGKPLYQSYLITDADRRAASIEGLAGDIHAFSDPDSNSGFLVTAAELARKGERPEHFFRQIFFTYGHRNVVRAVAAGLAESGSVDGYVYEVLSEVEPSLTKATRIVRKSDWFGFPPVASPINAAGSESTGVLRKAFVAMHHSPSGREVLQALRLDAFAAEDPSLFDPIAANMLLVRGMG